MSVRAVPQKLLRKERPTLNMCSIVPCDTKNKEKTKNVTAFMALFLAEENSIQLPNQ